MSNLHVNLDEANKHTPKGFDLVGNNTFPTKDENGLSTYEERMSLPKAIDFVDGTLAAPSTADGDIFVLTGSGTIHPDWGSATFDDWVRFKNSTAVKISPLAGYLCFDVTANEWKEYDGADWVIHDDTGATNLNEGATTTTTVDVDSSTGTNATLNEATSLRAGVMSSAKFDEVEANTLKVTNATHTGEVSGSGALTAQPTIISNKTTLGSLAGTEEFLINDGGVLKKVLASNVGGGDSIYTADGIIGAGRVATLTDSLTFSGGTTIIQGADQLGTSTAWLVEDSVGTDLLKVANDGSTTIGGNTQIDGALTINSNSAVSLVTDASTSNYTSIKSGGVEKFRVGYFSSTGAWGVETPSIGNILVINNSTGNIGFGTTPNVDFHFRRDDASGTSMKLQNSTGDFRFHAFGNSLTKIDLELQTTANVGSIWADVTNGLRLRTNGADRLIINRTTGNVTVNTDFRFNGAMSVNGVAGFTGTGAYTNFTITNGIITAAS